MSDEPKAVTLEQLDVFHNLIQYYAADARCTSLDEVRSGCLYKIAAIEAVLKEREWLITRAFCMGVERDQAIAALVFAKADVKRLRGACKYVSERIHAVPSALPPGTDMGLIQTELYNALAATEEVPNANPS